VPVLLSILCAVLCLLVDLAFVRSRPAGPRDIELLAKPNRW
jgi:hypothetical protein